jgi:hypothetical protein
LVVGAIAVAHDEESEHSAKPEQDETVFLVGMVRVGQE